MRVWFADQDLATNLSFLDNSRLIAQHREAAALLGMLAGVKHQRWVNHPLYKKFAIHHKFLVDVHDFTVREMQFRGWTGHSTPLDFEKYPNYTEGTIYVPSLEEVNFDRSDLTKRWMKEELEYLEGKRSRMPHWKNRCKPFWFSHS